MLKNISFLLIYEGVMKKLLITTLAILVSACACFDCDEEPLQIRTTTTNEAKLDCDYFDGRTCYRYVYKKPDHPIVRPAPVKYRKCQKARPSCNNCNTCNSCNTCGGKVSETREPVEVVYKKTTYQTVCDPKTVSHVSYETVPYVDTKPEPVKKIEENLEDQEVFEEENDDEYRFIFD